MDMFEDSSILRIVYLNCIHWVNNAIAFLIGNNTQSVMGEVSL